MNDTRCGSTEGGAHSYRELNVSYLLEFIGGGGGDGEGKRGGGGCLGADDVGGSAEIELRSSTKITTNTFITPPSSHVTTPHHHKAETDNAQGAPSGSVFFRCCTHIQSYW